ncbi:very-long-chain (3R)-3-hydroxyacyl-CoA dehydratase 2 isoform X3 [Alligator sinensis]|uniref:Very-long-chain (3R)-3-hydroxyacyl-CoA dehydratase n=1 Tax=Alligator sinensis TaxID=38654 RepID=A0A3Q0HBW1_ALLSI|nr:very-long-chain (3R)-3-hydroxyacyl-CoA dehydratase 2 isoform X3 [Alligator sinensis]
MTAGWLVIAVGLVRAYLAKGSYHNLYYSIEKPLKFFQTGALLEILHCAFGIVPSSVVLTAFQVMSRVFLTWAVTHSVKESSLSCISTCYIRGERYFLILKNTRSRSNSSTFSELFTHPNAADFSIASTFIENEVKTKSEPKRYAQDFWLNLCDDLQTTDDAGNSRGM